MYKRLINISFIKSEFATGGEIPTDIEMKNIIDNNPELTEDLKNTFTKYLKSIDIDKDLDLDNNDNLTKPQKENLNKILNYISERQNSEYNKEIVKKELNLESGMNLRLLNFHIGVMKITKETKVKKDILKTEVDETIELEKLVKSVKVKPEKGELKLYKEDGKYKLELDDYFLASTDPVYTFNEKPSETEIKEVVRNFNNSIELDGWENLPEEKQDKSPSKKLTEVRTQESTKKPEKSILGISVGSDSVNEYTENTELVKILKTKNHTELKDLLEKLTKSLIEVGAINKEKTEFNIIDFAGYRNFTKFFGPDIRNVLKDAGYDNGRLSASELGEIYSTISNYVKTQNEIEQNKMSDEDKIRLLLDFNKDGVLDIKKRSGVGEAQMEHLTLKGLLSQGVDVLVKNLGFESKEELFKLMGENLYKARESFQNALLSRIEGRTMPEELLMEDGLNKSAKRTLKENQNKLEKRKKEIVGLFIKDKFGVSSLDQLSKEQRSLTEKVMDALTPQALGLGVANDRFGGSVSWDMQDPTSLKGIPVLEEMGSIFDALTVGLSENGAGVIFSKGLFKEFFDKYGINLTLSWINLIIGSLTGSVRLNEAKLNEMKELFQETTKTKVEFRVVGGITSGLIITGGLQANFKNENTIAGIEEMSNQLYNELDKAGKDILSGNKNSTFFKNPEDQKAYSQLKNIFDRATDGLARGEKEKYMPLFIEGYVSNYRNKLNTNASGLTLSSVGIGVLLVPGFLPIPYITAGGELKWQEINLVKGEKIESNSVKYENIGGKLDEINGFKVLSFPKEEIHKLSVRDPNAQIEEKNGRIYISGVDPKTIKIGQITKNDVIKNILTVGDGEKEVSNYKTVVSEDLPTKSTEGINENLTLKESDLNDTSEIRKSLNQMISGDSLKKVKGMLKLQKDIFENRTKGEPNINDVWKEYISVINNKSFEKYASKNGNTEDLKNNSANINDENQRILVLQTVSNNLMEKGGLQPGDNGEDYEVRGGKKTIREYDGTGRVKFFDKLMSRELPDLAQDIANAREEWYDKNGDSTTYKSFSVIDGSIGFSGTESRNKKGEKNISGLTPYTGAYNVAGVDGDSIFVEITGNPNSVIDKIPDNALSLYLEQINTYLKKYGQTTLENTEDVKNFLKTGGNDKIHIDTSIFFCKNAECLNDCIALSVNIKVDGENIPLVIGGSSQSHIGAEKNKVMNLGALFTDKWERKPEKFTLPKAKPTEEKSPKTNPKAEEKSNTPQPAVNTTPIVEGEFNPNTNTSTTITAVDDFGNTITGNTLGNPPISTTEPVMRPITTIPPQQAVIGRGD